VHAEFAKYAPAVGLRVGLAAGLKDVAAEQREILCLSGSDAAAADAQGCAGGLYRRAASSRGGGVSAALRSLGSPFVPAAAPDKPWQHSSGGGSGCRPGFGPERGKLGSEGCVDVLVCTPGRLVDHLDRGERG